MTGSPPPAQPRNQRAPDDDKRFTFGLIMDVAEVLRRHGYPVPAAGNYDSGDVHREVGQCLWRLLYRDTDLGTRPARSTRPELPEPPSFDPPRQGVEL